MKLQVLGSADLDTGAHGGSDGAGADILTLGSSGLGKYKEKDALRRAHLGLCTVLKESFSSQKIHRP